MNTKLYLNNAEVNDLQIGNVSVDKIYLNNEIIYEKSSSLSTSFIFTVKTLSSGHYLLVKPAFILKDGSLLDIKLTKVSSEYDETNGLYTDTVTDQDGYMYVATAGTRYSSYNFNHWQGFDRTIYSSMGSSYNIDACEWYDLAVNSEVIFSTNNPNIIGLVVSMDTEYVNSWGSGYSNCNLTIDGVTVASYSSASASHSGESKTVLNTAYMKRHIFIKKDTGTEHYVAWAASEDKSTNKFKTYLLEPTLGIMAEHNNMLDIPNAKSYDKTKGTYEDEQVLVLDQTLTMRRMFSTNYTGLTIGDCDVELVDGTYVDRTTSISYSNASAPSTASIALFQGTSWVGMAEISTSEAACNTSYCASTGFYNAACQPHGYRWGMIAAPTQDKDIDYTIKIYTLASMDADRKPKATTYSFYDRYWGNNNNTSTTSPAYVANNKENRVMFSFSNATDYLNAYFYDPYSLMAVMYKDTIKLCYYKYAKSGSSPYHTEQKYYLRSKANPATFIEKTLDEIRENSEYDGTLNDLTDYTVQAKFTMKRTFDTASNLAGLSNSFIIMNNGLVADNLVSTADNSTSKLVGTIGYSQSIDAYADSLKIASLIIRCSAPAYNAQLGANFGCGLTKRLSVDALETSSTKNTAYKFEYYATDNVKAIVIGLFSVTHNTSVTNNPSWGYVHDDTYGKEILNTTTVTDYYDSTVVDTDAHYRLALIITKTQVYKAWLKVDTANYGTATENGNATKYRNLYLEGDILGDMKEFTLDEIIANKRTDGCFANDLSVAPNVEINFANTFDTTTKRGLYQGALFTSTGAVSNLVLDNTDTDTGNETIAHGKIKSILSSTSTFESANKADLFMNEYKLVAEDNATTSTNLKIVSGKANYVGISPIVNKHPSADGLLPYEVHNGYDYYKFSFYNDGSNTCPEQLKFHLKDGTTLVFIGYSNLTLSQNGITAGSIKADNSMYAIFSRDSNATYPSHGPNVTQVTYDPTDTKLVKIKVLAVNCYVNSTNNIMNLFCMDAGYVYGSYYYAYARDNSKDLDVYLILEDDSNFSWDEVDHFSITNYLDAYSYTSYGFRRLKYHRICVQNDSVIKEIEYNWTENKQNFNIEATDGIVVDTDYTNSSSIQVNGVTACSYTTKEELEANEIRTVKNVEYISRYLIDIANNKFAKCWVKRTISDTDVGICYIHNLDRDKMEETDPKTIIANNYANGEYASPFSARFTIKTQYSGWSVINKPVFILKDGSLLEPTFTIVESIKDTTTNEYIDTVTDQNGYTYTASAIGKHGTHNFFQGFDQTLYNKTSPSYDMDGTYFYTSAVPFDLLITTSNPDIIGIGMSAVCSSYSGWNSGYTMPSVILNDKAYTSYTNASTCATAESITGSDGNYMVRHLFIKNDKNEFEYYVAWCRNETTPTNKFKTYYKSGITTTFVEESNILTLINIPKYERTTGVVTNYTEKFKHTLQLMTTGATSANYLALGDADIYLADGTIVDAISTVTNVMSPEAKCVFVYKYNGEELGVMEISANCAVHSSESLTSPFVADGTRPYSHRWFEFKSGVKDLEVTFKISPFDNVAEEKHPKAVTVSPYDRYTVSSNAYGPGYVRYVDKDKVLYNYTTNADFMASNRVVNTSNTVQQAITIVMFKDDAKLAYYNPTYVSSYTLDGKLYLKSNLLPTLSYEKTLDEIIAHDRYDGILDDTTDYPIQSALTVKRTYATASNYGAISNSYLIANDGRLINKFVIKDNSTTTIVGVWAYEILEAYVDDELIGNVVLKSTGAPVNATTNSLGACFGYENLHNKTDESLISATVNKEYTLHYYLSSGFKGMVLGMFSCQIASTAATPRCWTYVYDKTNNRLVYETASGDEYKKTSIVNTTDAHYRLALVVTKDKTYNAWLQVDKTNGYGTTATAAAATRYRELYLLGDLANDVKQFTLDEIIANGRQDGYYTNDKSVLPTAIVQFGSNVADQTYSSLNLGAVYDASNNYLSDFSVSSTGVDATSNNPYEVIKSGSVYEGNSNIVYLESDYTDVNNDVSSLITNIEHKALTTNTDSTKHTLKVISNDAKYLAVSPINAEYTYNSISTAIDQSAYGNSDYYRFTLSGATVCNLLERFLFNLKDGTQLRYIGYKDEEFNKTYGSETYAYSVTAIFTRDQSVAGLTTTPKVVTYDPSDKNLVAIRVFSKTRYYSNSYRLMYSFMPVGSYKTLSAYGGMVSGNDQNFWICFLDDGNISIDEIESFTMSNCFEGHSYTYTQYGFTSMSYRRVDIKKNIEFGETTMTFSDYADNFIVPAIDAMKVIEGETSSTYLNINGTDVVNVSTVDTLNIQDTKIVNDVKYVSRYLIDLETKDYAKCWVPQTLQESNLPKSYIYYTGNGVMVNRSISDIVTNKYVNGEVDESIVLPSTWQLQFMNDRSYTGYHAFGFILPVINGMVYECTLASANNSSATINKDTIYYKLKAVADVSTDAKRLAYVNGTATTNSTLRTVDASLTKDTVIADDEIIISPWATNKWSNGAHYQPDYAFKPIKNTAGYYLLSSASANSVYGYNIIKIGNEAVGTNGSGLEGLIIIPRATGNTSRYGWHNVITVSGGTLPTGTIDDEISGYSANDFVLNRAFYYDVYLGTTTQIN